MVIPKVWIFPKILWIQDAARDRQKCGREASSAFYTFGESPNTRNKIFAQPVLIIKFSRIYVNLIILFQVFNKIMSYLPVKDLLRAGLVSRQWNEEASKYFRRRVQLRVYEEKDVKTVRDILRKSNEMWGEGGELSGISESPCRS